jgi:flagellar basal body rod protein FlgG
MSTRVVSFVAVCVCLALGVVIAQTNRPDQNEQKPHQTIPTQPKIASVLQPGNLPRPSNLTPIPQPLSQAVQPKQFEETDKAIRDIIRKALPLASPEELAAWENRLRGVSPRMAQNLLEMRQRFGSILPNKQPRPGKTPLTQLPDANPDVNRTDPGMPPLFHQPSQPRVIDPLPSPITLLPSQQATLHALRDAQIVLANNMANAKTPGFKRARVLLTNLSAPSKTAGSSPGIGLTVNSRDWSQGELCPSSRPLDIAISGEGFLQFQNGEKIIYTRCGRLSLNADHLLGTTIAGKHFPLEPSITFPEGSSNFIISADGKVTVMGKELNTVGIIQLVRFPNPDGLISQGNTFLEASPKSGQPISGSPGIKNLGTIRQGVLEASNCDLKQELAQLEQLSQQVQMLQHAYRLIHSPVPGFQTESLHQEQTARKPKALQSSSHSLISPQNWTAPRPQKVNRQSDGWKRYLKTEAVWQIERDLGLRP